MRPAFASLRHAAAYAVLLVAILLSPILVGKASLPPREAIYTSAWWNGNFPWLDRQIFSEKGDIDIAFVGPSHMWYGINAPYVQQKLSEKLGRPAVVRSICWGGGGYDELYFIARDLLEHRHVRMLVFYDAYGNMPNVTAPRWFRFGDDAAALDGLPLRLKASYYFAAVIGMPRTLLEMVRTNLPADAHPPQHALQAIDLAEDIPDNLGALVSRSGYIPPLYDAPAEPFESFTPSGGDRSSEASIYSDATRDQFAFTGGVLPPWQLHFARLFAHLAFEHGTKLVLIHIPVIQEMRLPVIQEREFWPDALKADVAMVGIPPAKMSEGMTDAEVRKLFAYQVHMNKNGQLYFASILTPSLLKLYAETVAN